jgi:hypothetical protein
MADNPLVQVSPSIVSAKRFVARRSEERCNTFGEVADGPFEVFSSPEPESSRIHALEAALCAHSKIDIYRDFSMC